MAQISARRESSGQNMRWRLREAGWPTPGGKEGLVGESAGLWAPPRICHSQMPWLPTASHLFLQWLSCPSTPAASAEVTHSGLSHKDPYLTWGIVRCVLLGLVQQLSGLMRSMHFPSFRFTVSGQACLDSCAYFRHLAAKGRKEGDSVRTRLTSICKETSFYVPWPTVRKAAKITGE